MDRFISNLVLVVIVTGFVVAIGFLIVVLPMMGFIEIWTDMHQTERGIFEFDVAAGIILVIVAIVMSIALYITRYEQQRRRRIAEKQKVEEERADRRRKQGLLEAKLSKLGLSADEIKALTK